MVGSLAPCALSALLRPAPLLGLFGVLARCPFVPGPCPFMRSFSPSVGCCGLPSAQLLAPCALLRFKACAGSFPWVYLLSSAPVRVLFGSLGPPAPLPPLLALRALISFFRACAPGGCALFGCSWWGMPWRLYGVLLDVGLSRIRLLLFSGIHFVAWAVTFLSHVIAEHRSLIVDPYMWLLLRC